MDQAEDETYFYGSCLEAPPEVLDWTDPACNGNLRKIAHKGPRYRLAVTNRRRAADIDFVIAAEQFNQLGSVAVLYAASLLRHYFLVSSPFIETCPTITAWPMFYGDARHTGQSPFIASQTATPKWAFAPDPASGFSIAGSPVVGKDGKIYISVENNSFVGKLYAILPSGSFKWETDPIQRTIGTTPAIGADGTIYVGNWNGSSLFAFNPDDGKPTWPLLPFAGQGVVHPTVAPDGTIYFTNQFPGEVRAVGANGILKWDRFLGALLHVSSPAVGLDGNIYVGRNALKAFDVNGNEEWTSPDVPGVLSSPSVGSDGTIYVWSNSSRKLYALNPSTGREIWSALVTGSYTAVLPPAIAPDGTIILALSGNPPIIQAVSPVTRAPTWNFPLGNLQADPTGVAIGADGTVYVGLGFSAAPPGPRLFAVNPDGSLKWSFNASFATGNPAIGNDGTVYAVLFDGQRVVLQAIGPPQ
jgi:outer membrane protein assembly factor BamB